MVLVVLGFCCDWFAVGLFMVGFDLLGLVGVVSARLRLCCWI